MSKSKNTFHKPEGEHMYYAYMLICGGGWKYVGITQSWEKRFAEHRRGGSIITRLHKPIAVGGVWQLGVMRYEDAEFIENEFVKFFAQKYKRKVRGGGWCLTTDEVELDDEVVDMTKLYKQVEVQFDFENKPSRKATKKSKVAKSIKKSHKSKKSCKPRKPKEKRKRMGAKVYAKYVCRGKKK